MLVTERAIIRNHVHDPLSGYNLKLSIHYNKRLSAPCPRAEAITAQWNEASFRLFILIASVLIRTSFEACVYPTGKDPF